MVAPSSAPSIHFIWFSSLLGGGSSPPCRSSLRFKLVQSELLNLPLLSLKAVVSPQGVEFLGGPRLLHLSDIVLKGIGASSRHIEGSRHFLKPSCCFGLLAL
eukprot:m.257764 g.257764  ORF g.257764 m.257764 type:complete len:102 (+) comp54571_c2_seq18:285-590(+)